MKNIVLTFIFITGCLAARCQDSTLQKSDTALQTEKYWQNWITDLYEVGIEQKADTLKLSAEVKKIILDKEYQKIIYPADYNIPAAGALMKKMEIKKAMWYLINLYGKGKEYKEMVLKIILPFEQGLEMDKVLISTFYTYAMVDPQVGTFQNGKIQINRPDILEQKFNTLKEMVAYIIAQRKTQNINAQKAIGATKSDQLQKLGSGEIKNHIKENK